MGLNDGLGFEEANQSGLNTNLSQAVSGIYTRTEGTSYIGDANGQLNSVSLGSPGAFGAIVQAGSAATAAGSGGFIALRQAYSSNDYTVVITPFSGGSIAAFVSGVKNATSGVNFVGGPSNRYGWVAVGI